MPSHPDIVQVFDLLKKISGYQSYEHFPPSPSYDNFKMKGKWSHKGRVKFKPSCTLALDNDGIFQQAVKNGDLHLSGFILYKVLLNIPWHYVSEHLARKK